MSRKKLLPEALQRTGEFVSPPKVSFLAADSIEAFEREWKRQSSIQNQEEFVRVLHVFKAYLEFLGAKITDDNIGYLTSLAFKEVPAMHQQKAPNGRPSRWRGIDGWRFLVNFYALKYNDRNISDRSAAEITVINLGWSKGPKAIADSYDVLKKTRNILEPVVIFLEKLSEDFRERGIERFPFDDDSDEEKN